MGTVIVGFLVACCAFLAIRSMYNDRKSKKSSCGADCSRCGRCH